MSAIFELWIPGRLPGRNAVTSANRASIGYGASVKRDATASVYAAAVEAGSVWIPGGWWLFEWREANKRRDPDNIESGIKFIFDGLQEAGVIDNDNWAAVRGIAHLFLAGPPVPGVLVLCYESGAAWAEELRGAVPVFEALR